MAGVVTIWPPDKLWSKAVWLLVFGSFLFAEVTTLYQQRADDQQTDSSRRKEEDDRFAGLLKMQQDSFAAVLSRNQQQFEATLKRVGAVLTKTQEAISDTTGGGHIPVCDASR